MKQVGSDGKFIDSASPSPKSSPNRVGEGGGGGGEGGGGWRGEGEGPGMLLEHQLKKTGEEESRMVDPWRRGVDYSALVEQIQLIGVGRGMQGMYVLDFVGLLVFVLD